MRAFALLLILANLGFLGWSQLIDVRYQRAGEAVRMGASSPPRLVLTTEAVSPSINPPMGSAAANADHAAAEGAEVVESVPAETVASETAVAAITNDVACVSVGAFRDLTAAVQASAALQTAGYFSRQRVEQGEVWLGYWVSVQNLASREEAEKALEELNGRGISDAYILPASDPPNVLSLGVFTDAARAQRRVAEIRDLGFDAQVADRKRAGSVYWIDVDLPAPGEMFDSAILQSEPGRIVRLEFRPCPNGGQAAVEAPPLPG